jgi:hypothetical protein
MQISIRSARFEFTADRLGVFLRIGRREFYWNREAGLVKD